jgi:hypothetical protein
MVAGVMDLIIKRWMRRRKVESVSEGHKIEKRSRRVARNFEWIHSRFAFTIGPQSIFSCKHQSVTQKDPRTSNKIRRQPIYLHPTYTL